MSPIIDKFVDDQMSCTYDCIEWIRGDTASVLLNFKRQFNAKISECTTVRAGMLSKDTPRCISVITPLKCIFDLDSRHRVNNFPRSAATDFAKQF